VDWANLEDNEAVMESTAQETLQVAEAGMLVG
jgi:hypothetical protein